MVELFASSKFLQRLLNHVLNAFHDVGVRGRLAIEVSLNIHFLALIVVLYVQGHLRFDFLVAHIAELLDMGRMLRVFLIADLLPDTRLLCLILFVDVKIGHIHSSCGYFLIKEEGWGRLIVLIDYSWRRGPFPRAQAAWVHSG